MRPSRKLKIIPQSPLRLRSQNRKDGKEEGSVSNISKDNGNIQPSGLENTLKQKWNIIAKTKMSEGSHLVSECTSSPESSSESLSNQQSPTKKKDSDDKSMSHSNKSNEPDSSSCILLCGSCLHQFSSEEALLEHIEVCSASDRDRKIMSCIFDSCKETYPSKQLLMDHLKDAHCSKLSVSDKHESAGSLVEPSAPGKLMVPLKRTKDVYKCPNCNGRFRRTDNFTRHYEKCSTSNLKKRRTPCVIDSCSETFAHKSALMNHLRDVHSAKISPPQILNFKTEMDYKLWKDDEESRTFSYFSSESGCKKYKVGGNGTRKYYYCQYDGPLRTHRKKGEPERKTTRKRKSGPVKTGMICLARMVVTTLPDGSVHVEYHPTHNHKPDSRDCAHQPATKSVNDLIQNQIALRVPPTIIYENLQSFQLDSQNNEGGKPAARSTAITKRAIQQRAIKFRKTMRLHEDDSQSTDLLVERLGQEDYDPVIIYKPHGKPIVVGPHGINCPPEDIDSLFMLGLQTKEQKSLMLEGSKKVLLVDTTRYVTQLENGKVLNFLVCDENNRAVAVAHFISNRMSANVIGHFVEALRHKYEDDGEILLINCVISADDPVLIKGMEQGMGITMPHILCLWNLDSSLQDALQKKVVTTIKDPEGIDTQDLKDLLYADLMVLISILDKKHFEESVVLFKDKYSSEAPKFINYFEKNYLDRPEKWAKCYRESLSHGNIDTICFAEFFHNRLKTGFSQRVTHIRIDDLVNHLLDIEKHDKAARKHEADCGLSATSKEVLERHNNSLLMPDDSIGEKNDKFWLVNSSKSDEVYKIECLWDVCQKNDCRDKCPSASCIGLCSHLYHCTCPDTIPLCKHIHKLYYLLTQGSGQLMEENSDLFHITTDETVETSDVEDYYSNLQNGLATLCDMVEKRQIPSPLLQTCVATVTSLIEKCQILKVTEPVLDYVELPAKKNSSTHNVQTLPVEESNCGKEEVNDMVHTKSLKSINDLIVVVKSEDNNCESSEDVDDPSYITVDNTIDPHETLLCIGEININLLDIKSLDLDLNEEEANTYKLVSPSFRVGWMVPAAANAFLSILSSSNDKTFCLSTDYVLSLFHGDLLSQFFNKEMYEKNIFIFPLVLSEDHWAILVLFADKAEMRCLDPIMRKLTPDLVKLVHSVNSIMKIVRPDISKWSLRFISHLSQIDAVNCGVHVCWFAHEAILQYEKHSPLSDVREYRKFICDTICGHCLDYSEDNVCGLCGKTLFEAATISCCRCGRSFHCKCVPTQPDSSAFVCPSKQQ